MVAQQNRRRVFLQSSSLLINDQINPIRAPKWIYGVKINYASQVTFDVKEQRRLHLYHYDSHV